jgi:type II secretory pathway predicted ATPase ExeA/pSer/pThr/pTyr-binding forkhead associated (FHA) protein
MYLSTFKLKEAPFEANPDARYLYLSKGHARAKAYMESAVSTADDFVVITGEEGLGKTMLINAFRLELDKRLVVAHLTQAPISTNEFLQALLEQFGYIPFRGNKAALLATVNTYLAEQRTAGRKVLLLIDEAQNLAPPLLEQLRALVVTEPGQESPLRVILVGQPALNQQLDTPELTELAQRARLRFHLTALTPDQTHGYVVHRLAIAGSHGREIFQPGCFEVIDRYTDGAPRLINSLGDAALGIAGADGRDQVSPDDVEAAALTLQLPALAERFATHDAPPAAEAAPEAAAAAPPSPSPAPLAKDLTGPRIARLRVMSAGQLLVEHPLRVGRMMLGRASDADLQIDDRTVSRHHCQIISNEFLSVIQDLNSTNGVYVKDHRVRRHNLSDGDVVVLGSFQVLYLDEREGEQPDYQGELAKQPPRRRPESNGEVTQN